MGGMRQFDLIEKKYNKLIEQKTVFAKRALARIHYILQEGSSDEDHIVKLINLLDHHANSPQVLEQMRDRIRVGTQFKNITDRSFYNRKNAEDAGFHPIAMEKHDEETQMTDFVPKTYYSFYCTNLQVISGARQPVHSCLLIFRTTFYNINV